MRVDIAEAPPLELTVVVEPFDLPAAPSRPPTPTGGVPLSAVATAVSALVFAALTWWALGG